MIARALAAIALLLPLAGACRAAPGPAHTVVSFESDGRELKGLLYRPEGAGPFRAIVYNHGSAPGMDNTQAFDAIAPAFTARGWVFFAPYRRGQGLSPGPYIMDEIAAARAKGGEAAAAERMVELLSGEHLHDQLSALAWLKTQPYVRKDRIAVMGNSFGGIETVLGAAAADYCAAVDASGGAETWTRAARLRSAMTEAAVNARAPVLFFQAANDFSTEPSAVLSAAMRAAGRPAEVRIYPPFGASPQAGHSFAWRGVGAWQGDVAAFLDRNCPP
jgi:carboxymethylenebutenolidase